MYRHFFQVNKASLQRTGSPLYSLMFENVVNNILFVLLKSVRVHFAPGKIAITFEILGQFPRFLDQNERHGL